jgi:CHAD domain-containing protein
MRRSETNLTPGSVNGHPLASNTDLSPDTLKVLALSLKDHWKRYRKQLRKCQRKASEGAVHDLRVIARRLLSLLDLLSPFLPPGRLARAQAALKCHLDTFDDLRDTQVQLAAVGKLREGFPAARQFDRFLKKREGRLCQSSRKQAKRLRNKPLAKLISACRDDAREWQRRCGSPQTNKVLVRTLARAFAATARLKKRIHADNTHSIHCTRIAFKKFRYMVEAISGCLAFANEQLLEKMRRYQGLMGDIQDAQVLLEAFERFSRKEEIAPRDAARLRRELLRRRERLIAAYLMAADRLLEFWPRAPGATNTSHQHTVPGIRQTQNEFGLPTSDSPGPTSTHSVS